MGYYINPSTMPKEAWLARHGQPTSPVPPPPGQAVVCLVDNGPFTAAGIAYSPEELAEFSRPDGRPRQWFLVPKVALTEDVVRGEVPFAGGF